MKFLNGHLSQDVNEARTINELGPLNFIVPIMTMSPVNIRERPWEKNYPEKNILIL